MRFLRDIGSFLRGSETSALDAIRCGVEGRAASFRALLELAVHPSDTSPYRRLLDHAGIDRDEIDRWLASDGLEPTLGRLADAGVRLTLDEFKGRTVVRRGPLEFRVRPEDLANPVRSGHGEVRSGGSRGPAARLLVDLDVLAHEAQDIRAVYEAHGVADRPVGIWLPVPPGSAGVKNLLRQARLGRAVDRWFSQLAPGLARGRGHLFLALVLGACRRRGRAPRPREVPPDRPDVVARWMAERRRTGTPALLVTYAASAVRICRVARARRWDLRGSAFHVVGEPFTAAKARAIAAARCVTMPTYSMAEIGFLGLPCAAPTAPDDVHLALDKVAVIRRPRDLGETTVDALLLTTLLPESPRVMVNVESGDHATVERRSCGCHLESAGLDVHVHGIRSHEKLTGEGVAFLGGDLIEVLEETLPAAHGGGPTDYQLVESEVDGVPCVELRVASGVGPVDSERVRETLLDALSRRDGPGRMMAEQWRRAGTLRVVSTEPLPTGVGKILPLHVR